MAWEQGSLFPIDEPTAAAYREGVDPHPVHAPAVRNRIFEMLAEVGAGESMRDLIARWHERLSNDPEAKLRAELAHKAGISYEMALERWGTPDSIAVALAGSIIRAEEHDATCQGCGTKPSDWVFWLDRSDDGLPPLLREKDHTPWKFTLHDCYGCDGLHHRNSALSAEDRSRGVRWIIQRKQPWESTEDGFDL